MSETPPGYQQGYPAYLPPRDHPQATTVLVLGILGIVACQVLGPIAWVLGGRAKRDIDESPRTYGGRGQVVAGYVCGIVATVMLVFYVIILVVFLGVLLNDPTFFEESRY